MPELGRFLIIAGIVLVVVGLVFVFGGRLGFGRLPGDFVFHKGNTTIFVPLATCILLSLLLTLVMWLLRK